MAHPSRKLLLVLFCTCLIVMTALQWSLTGVLKSKTPISNTSTSSNTGLTPISNISITPIANGSTTSNTDWTPGTNLPVASIANAAVTSNTDWIPETNIPVPSIANASAASSNTDTESDISVPSVANGSPTFKSDWTPETNISVKERRFTPSENNQVFILGAVAKNSTSEASWDRVTLYGQWYNHRSVDVLQLKCCLKYSNGSVTQSNTFDQMVRGYPRQLEIARLVVWHIACVIPGTAAAPTLVSIARYSSCEDSSVSYIKPHYAMKEPDGYTVITTKLAYGKVRPVIVIGYLEAVKALGINKVIAFVCNNLDPMVKKILRYYAYQGLLEYNTVEFADVKRTRHVLIPEKPYAHQYRNDEWVVIRDALERNVGASFFGIFDMDEYLVPSGNRSIPQLLIALRNRHPRASNFWFKNVHYLTDSSTCKKKASNCSLFQRHIMISPWTFNTIHRKMFLIPSRVQTKTICNHYIRSMAGFRQVTIHETEAYIRHYGSCARKFKNKICHAPGKWVVNTTMLKWAERTILNTVRKVLTFFGL